ncbi:hypothetical protein THAOC_24352 [Thalassiosira oceanica]|uniref:Uncharacterized protein n=1 Tax=Thalassiosira oceanica TaxID=159749 RepID=K0RQ10_THAOC|nr:hypothetical protein THAOC_24352 [Thalassiosira oceanica]|eukprot:EJK55863.1 hypothetical protein THAOC_24352 [Thalassiosira oceanica]
MKIEVPRSGRSAWKVALSNALGLEVTERVPERPGKAPDARNCRDFATGLRQRVPSVGKTRRACRGVRTAELDEVVGNVSKVASRKALAELYK